MYNKCKECVTDKSLCTFCPDNPEYVHIERYSLFSAYKPTCPRGFSDCVRDPAYIKYNYPSLYAEYYGDKTPEEAAEGCRKRVEEDPDMEGFCYDDEDK